MTSAQRRIHAGALVQAFPAERREGEMMTHEALTTREPEPRLAEQAQVALPEEGYALPLFEATGDDGGVTRLRDLKQRRPTLLALLPSLEDAAARRWVAQLAARMPAFEEYRVVALVITPDTPERLAAARAELALGASPVRLLSDTTGAVAARYLAPADAHGAQGMALYAADRYTYLLRRWSAATLDEAPAADEALAEFAYADQEGCGCSCPAWPPHP